VIYCGLSIFYLFLLLPIAWLILSSFRNSDSIQSGRLLPAWSELTVKNYLETFHIGNFVTYLVNSFVIAFSVMVLTVFLGSLGAYAAFQHICHDPAAPERICPGVSALLDHHARTYRETLRCYLDCAGQAQQAAEQLHIHRTTLYWRLARAAELVPLDLHQGGDRLKLHLALTLADLTHPLSR